MSKRAPRDDVRGREEGRRPRRPRVEYSEELKAKIRQKAKTMTVDGIAELLDLTESGVRYVLRE